MESGTNLPIEDDPANAFAALRGEVSLLRRAIEGLTAERQNVSDYTPTLAGMSRRLSHVEELLEKVAESPAMRLTPEDLALSIARASEIARARDCRMLDKAGATLRESTASINEIVERAWAADRQWKQLYWTAGGSFIIGAVGAVVVLHLIG